VRVAMTISLTAIKYLVAITIIVPFVLMEKGSHQAAGQDAFHGKVVASYSDDCPEREHGLVSGRAGFRFRLVRYASENVQLLWSSGSRFHFARSVPTRCMAHIPKGIYKAVWMGESWTPNRAVLESSVDPLYLHDARMLNDGKIGLLWSKLRYDSTKGFLEPGPYQVDFATVDEGGVGDSVRVLDDDAMLSAAVFGNAENGYPSAFLVPLLENQVPVIWIDRRDCRGLPSCMGLPRHRDINVDANVLTSVTSPVRKSRRGVSYYSAVSDRTRVHLLWVASDLMYSSYFQGKWETPERVLNLSSGVCSYAFGLGVSTDSNGLVHVLLICEIRLKKGVVKALWHALRSSDGQWRTYRESIPNEYELSNQWIIKMAAGQSGTVHALIQPSARYGARPLVYTRLDQQRMSRLELIAENSWPGQIDVAAEGNNRMHFAWVTYKEGMYRLLHAAHDRRSQY
jgi:hypothetical protein